MINYTTEQTQMMLERYKANPCRETVDALAKELDKSVKSIIGKLSREGVYRREAYTTKTGEKPITKLEIVQMIADGIGVETEQLQGLDKTPKRTLKFLQDQLAAE